MNLPETLDCFDFYLWSIGELRIPPQIELKIFNELQINQLIYGSELYE